MDQTSQTQKSDVDYTKVQDIVIIGTGPAGLTAAIYAARSGNNPIIFAGMQHGGQLTTTTDVENFPGFAEGILGPKLMQEMTNQAIRVGSKVIYQEITEVDFSKDIKLLKTSEHKTVKARCVILATGATAKTLGIENEAKLMGHGLSTCATCDGFFYRNKTVMVIGGGDSAMEESLYLADLASKVYLVHRRDHFRASKIMLKRAKKHKKIEFLIPWTLKYLATDDAGNVNQAILMNTQNKETEKLVTVDGVFYAIGHTPNSKIFSSYLDVDEHGYVKVHDFVKTKATGVFAAGDLADKHFRQAITAAAMGCQAAMTAAKYIQNIK